MVGSGTPVVTRRHMAWTYWDRHKNKTLPFLISKRMLRHSTKLSAFRIKTNTILYSKREFGFSNCEVLYTSLRLEQWRTDQMGMGNAPLGTACKAPPELRRSHRLLPSALLQGSSSIPGCWKRLSVGGLRIFQTIGIRTFFQYCRGLFFRLRVCSTPDLHAAIQ